MRRDDPGRALALAEKVFAILDEGAFSATYKYAVMLALLDLCFEKTTARGEPPQTLTTRELAEKVLALYWPQCVPYDGGDFLRQGSGGQAEIVQRIIEFRRDHDTSDSAPRSATPEYERLVRFIEWKLIEMPIPRLQILGATEDRVLYEYGWSQDVRQGVVSAYQRGDPGAFDNRLLLGPGVGAALMSLNTLLRPFIQREWLRLVEQFNRARLPQARLAEFLFDRDRAALLRVRAPLLRLQDRRCFYCRDALASAVEVDHFVPWARYPNNAIDNLVASHARCNNQKRDFLAAAPHVESWLKWRDLRSDDLAEVARAADWEAPTPRSRSVALALYELLPDDARVWRAGKDFSRYAEERTSILKLLRAA